MKKYSLLLLVFLMGGGLLFAQEAAEKSEGHHQAVFNKPDALVANTIVWVSVSIVVIALVLSIKYLVKPNEKNPNHIKNIVKDEGF